jgi:uncharacterized protein (TIGR03435 family)
LRRQHAPTIAARQTLLATTILALVGSVATAFGQGAKTEIGVGAVAPELVFERLLQAPGSTRTDWQSLRGKVVVLEFWATWCAPCVASMPHLNTLAANLRDKPIQFISITDEDQALISHFLQRRKIAGWVGLDTDRSVFKGFGVITIPYMVVVGPDGRIAVITKSKDLTSEKLVDVLAGNQSKEAPGPIPASPVPVPKRDEAEVPARFTLTIKPTETVSSYMSRDDGKFQARAATLNMILSFLYNVSKARIVGSTQLEGPRYAISATMIDGDNEQFEPILMRSIEASFKLKVRKETREMDVFVLSVPNGTIAALPASTSKFGHSSDDAAVVAASGVPLRVLVDGLEGVLKQPVVDETDLKGRYDWTLVYDEKNPTSVIDEVRKELGLELKRAKRLTEVLVVSTIEPKENKN